MLFVGDQYYTVTLPSTRRKGLVRRTGALDSQDLDSARLALLADGAATQESYRRMIREDPSFFLDLRMDEGLVEAFLNAPKAYSSYEFIGLAGLVEVTSSSRAESSLWRELYIPWSGTFPPTYSLAALAVEDGRYQVMELLFRAISPGVSRAMICLLVLEDVQCESEVRNAVAKFASELKAYELVGVLSYGVLKELDVSDSIVQELQEQVITTDREDAFWSTLLHFGTSSRAT